MVVTVFSATFYILKYVLKIIGGQLRHFANPQLHLWFCRELIGQRTKIPPPPAEAVWYSSFNNDAFNDIRPHDSRCLSLEVTVQLIPKATGVNSANGERISEAHLAKDMYHD